MPHSSLRDQYLHALVSKGESVVGHRSSKYTVTTAKLAGPSKDGKPQFFYLGKAGSLRIGRTIAGSIPLSDGFKEKLLQTHYALVQAQHQEVGKRTLQEMGL